MIRPIIRMASCMLSAVLMLTGCSFPRPMQPSSISCPTSDRIMTVDDFRKVMKQNSFPVINTISLKDNNEYRHVRSGIKADMPEKYAFSYYILDSKNTAKSFYALQKQEIQKSYDSNESFIAVSERKMDNYADYTNDINDRYYRVICRDNAVLVVSSKKDYQKTVNKIIDRLGM